MFNWTLTFLVLASVSGVLGFSDLAGGTAAVAQILCILFLVLFVLSGLSVSMKSKNL